MSRNEWAAIGSGTIAYVLGDSMSDIYENVRLTKIAPDVPAPVWELDGNAVHCAGGAGNVAQQLRYLSADVTLAHLCSASEDVATSQQSARLRSLSRFGVRNVKTRFVSGGHILARLDDYQAAPLEVRVKNVRGLIEELRTDLENRGVKEGAAADGKRVVAILSDYAAGFWHYTTAIQAVALFAGFGVPMIVDPKPRGMALADWAGATVLKLNEREAREFAATDHLNEAMKECRRVTGAQAVVVTRGGLPPLVCGNGQGEFPPEPLPFGSVLGTDRPLWASGAGDCFAAYLAASVAERGRLSVAGVTRAHAAGAVYTTKRYNEPVHPREAMERAGYAGAKRYTDPRELASRISALPTGAKIGYTNGIFDMLHAGHISGLQWARVNCDFLCVFVNSDSSVFSLRAVNPVMWFEERAAALAALSCVDAVVGFNELDPRRAFASAGMCHTLFKGEAYRDEELKGQEFAAQVAFIPETVKLHSSAIRERAAKRYEEAKLSNRGRKEGDS